MTVIQQQKVHPNMDYWLLNWYVNVFRANVDIYVTKLREWCKEGMNISLLIWGKDIFRCMLTNHCGNIKTIGIWNRIYCLGFILNIAPKIMKAIIEPILSQIDRVKKSVSTYIDKNFVNGSFASTTYLKEHCDQESLREGMKVLGLELWVNLVWFCFMAHQTL